LTHWHDRPQATAAYLNPAFIAALIATAARGYEAERQQPMAWPMAFIIAPMLLHRPTRQALPDTTATHLSTWVSRNALVNAGFAARAKNLTPAVNEALRFGLRQGALTLQNGGVIGSVRTTKDPELRTLLNNARLVGRWLAKTDQPATVFALLGVEP